MKRRHDERQLELDLPSNNKNAPLPTAQKLDALREQQKQTERDLLHARRMARQLHQERKAKP